MKTLGDVFKKIEQNEFDELGKLTFEGGFKDLESKDDEESVESEQLSIAKQFARMEKTLAGLAELTDYIEFERDTCNTSECPFNQFFEKFSSEEILAMEKYMCLLMPILMTANFATKELQAVVAHLHYYAVSARKKL
jgi:hypothetical protein